MIGQPLFWKMFHCLVIALAGWVQSELGKTPTSVMAWGQALLMGRLRVLVLVSPHDSGISPESLSTIDLSALFTETESRSWLTRTGNKSLFFVHIYLFSQKIPGRGVDLGDFRVNIAFASLITNDS
jgi:hypothetical protein